MAQARYTHGHHDSVLRSHRWRTAENSAGYLLSHLHPGMDLLDVGCGPGTITRDLARRVAPGSVVGLDASSSVIDEAAGGSEIAGLTFEVGDLFQLRFDNAQFDVVHAHQVLQHVDDPVAALTEMRRVCRPGGIVAVRDADLLATRFFPDDPVLERAHAAYGTLTQVNGANWDAGRKLLHWALEVGFSSIAPSASAWCFATPADRAWWGDLWADRYTQSSVAEQLLEHGIATREDLSEFAAAYRRWAECPDGWWAVLHSEVVCTV
jgi:SAM-dependent methyltransferase